VPLRLDLVFPSTSAASRLIVGRGALAGIGRATARACAGAARALVVTDHHVAPLYADRVLRSLRRAGIAAGVHVVPAGERSKSAARLVALWDMCGRAGIGRGDAIVALGGGVVGDLAGFGAATWLRGVAWVGVPTSLLAQVDSGVGGKTAIDLPGGKNLAGAFHQPRLVIADPDVLETLPARHRRAGLAEVVKMGFACDAPLFAWCERNADALAAGMPEALEEAVVRAVRVKARVVRRDQREREGGTRTALNFGHTLGHAYEAARGYRGVLHGEAVAVGMRLAARLSVREAGLADAARARLERVLDRLGLRRRLTRVSVHDLVSAMRVDKKRDARTTRWVLTPQIGRASVPRPLDSRRIARALIEFGAQT
jgi:3-dehydroquinate synthase